MCMHMYMYSRHIFLLGDVAGTPTLISTLSRTNDY
jgi:hypothetical protein